MKETKSTNPQLIQLVRFLKKESRDKEARVWRDLAKHLSKTRQQRAAVNLSRINRHTQKDDAVVVPGKILGAGVIDHSLTVAALNASDKAKEKLKMAKATYLSIPELVAKNPKGINVKIIR
jgi:large subunit ribosomal protein L18e